MGRAMTGGRDDRARDRCHREGAGALRDDELLALVLGSGPFQEDPLVVAHRLLGALGDLGALARIDGQGLQRIPGVGPVKSARVLAALELCCRVGGGGAGLDPLARLRAQVPGGERALLAYRIGDDAPPITLALGEALGESTRPGHLIAQLLSQAGQVSGRGRSGPWSIVSVRPGRVLCPAETVAGRRLHKVAQIVGVAVERVVVIGSGVRRWVIDAGGSIDEGSGS